jgi:hypothetical protein
MAFVWFIAGGAIAILSGLSIEWTIGRIRPGSRGRALVWCVGGAIARWALAALVLIAALEQGGGGGLLAFVGMWLGRWVIAWHLSKRLKADKPIGI